ncbi:MAG: hypothetical protein Q4A75_03525 [Peptostreptococcaceae bacterium]|nr:hypothetical protein [Peptostreptococcaceae bacterium]
MGYEKTIRLEKIAHDRKLCDIIFYRFRQRDFQNDPQNIPGAALTRIKTDETR